MQSVEMKTHRGVRLLLRHPDFYIGLALIVVVLTMLLRPTEIDDSEVTLPDITATGIVERPAYAFDPGPSFFGASLEEAPRIAFGGGDIATGHAAYQTYREDTGPGFFDLVEWDNSADLDLLTDPAADIFARLFDAPLPALEDVGVQAAEGLPNDGVLRLRVEDFGAVPDPAVDNRQAIQDAIDYAHALGGGVIHLDEGTYGISGDPRAAGALKLRSNTFLQGVGMGRSVLRLVDDWSGTLVGLVRTPHSEATVNYGMADLTLDGNRAVTSGKVDAFYSGGRPGSPISDEDAWVLRVEARDFSGYGFDPHERTLRLTIADSIARNNGTDGFVADYIVNGVYRRNIAIGNGRHGFNIVTTSNHFILEDSVAHGNGGAGLVVQRGDEAIPSPHNLSIGRMRLTDNEREGALVRLSQDVELHQILSAGNGTYGVRVQGSRNVLLRDSIVMDNSRSGRGRYAAVQIRAEADAVTGDTHPARNVVVRDNVIGWQVPLEQRAAVHEVKGDVEGTVVTGNRFRGNFRRTVQIGSRDTISLNHRLETAWLLSAVQGLAGRKASITETVDCRRPDIRPDGCEFPDVESLWPADLE